MRSRYLSSQEFDVEVVALNLFDATETWCFKLIKGPHAKKEKKADTIITKN